MDTRTGALVEVVVGDDAPPWRDIGFSVDDEGVCTVGSVRLRLAGAHRGRGRGILGWTLAGCAALGHDIDGLPTGDAGDLDAAAAVGRSTHANGVVQLDHLVVVTPDLDRTTAALEAVGVGARRTREAGRGRLQRFFRLGEVIVEVVGPAEPSKDGPARFWGFAFTVADLDATADLLTGRVTDPKPAVQPGRRIATLRASSDQVSVPVAFMSRTVGPG